MRYTVCHHVSSMKNVFRVETPTGFLGSHIRNCKSDQTKMDSLRQLKRGYNKTVEIKIPKNVIKKKKEPEKTSVGNSFFRR